jgi:hypothetical protein
MDNEEAATDRCTWPSLWPQVLFIWLETCPLPDGNVMRTLWKKKTRNFRDRDCWMIYRAHCLDMHIYYIIWLWLLYTIWIGGFKDTSRPIFIIYYIGKYPKQKKKYCFIYSYISCNFVDLYQFPVVTKSTYYVCKKWRLLLAWASVYTSNKHHGYFVYSLYKDNKCVTCSCLWVFW